MNEQIYTDLKNALGAFGTQFTTALEKAGAATELGYNIVKQRVIAESVITLISTIIFIAILHFLYENVNEIYKNEICEVLFGALVLFFVVIYPFFVFNAVANLLSPDYATIERIVSLAKSVK